MIFTKDSLVISSRRSFRKNRKIRTQVGLATGARETCHDVLFDALRIGDAQDEHVLSQPALSLAQDRANTKCETLFAEKRVASVSFREIRMRKRLEEVFEPETWKFNSKSLNNFSGILSNTNLNQMSRSRFVRVSARRSFAPDRTANC